MTDATLFTPTEIERLRARGDPPETEVARLLATISEREDTVSTRQFERSRDAIVEVVESLATYVISAEGKEHFYDVVRLIDLMRLRAIK